MVAHHNTRSKSKSDGGSTELNEYEFLECRSFGHAWSIHMTDAKPSWGFLYALKCNRCSMERLDTINRLGAVSTRRYRQPHGYRNPGHSDRSEYRVELMRRLTTKRKSSK